MKHLLSPEVRSFLSTLHELANEFEAYLRRPEVREAISRLAEVLREEERRRCTLYLPRDGEPWAGLRAVAPRSVACAPSVERSS